eukprot:ANDGO_01607.mRNA.1 DNA (cytosine-5)-methyltransferase
MGAVLGGRELRVVEWFAGTGGLHCALDRALMTDGQQQQQQQQQQHEIVAAIDISEAAQRVYAWNFPSVKFIRKTIERIKVEDAAWIRDTDLWLMSPPCQPFVLNGRNIDARDTRNAALFRILSLVHTCQPKAVFLENVKQFALSETHQVVRDRLRDSGYVLDDVVCSPVDWGIPYDRKRYYLVAVRADCCSAGTISLSIPVHVGPLSQTLERYLCQEEALVPQECWFTPEQEEVMIAQTHRNDIVFPHSTSSSAFTKSYAAKWNHFRGTGSVLCTNAAELGADVAMRSMETERYIPFVKGMKLRYVSPAEILRIHEYPASYSFPAATTLHEQWALLGNGVHIGVCAHILKQLLDILLQPASTPLAP